MKLILFPILSLLFLEVAHSGTRSPALEHQSYYVTHAGCRIYEGRDLDPHSPGIQSVEIWASLSQKNSQYDPDVNQRASIETEDDLEARRLCEDLYQVYKSKRPAKFNLSKKQSGSFRILKFAPILTQNFSMRFSDELNVRQDGEIEFSESNLREEVIRNTLVTPIINK